MLKTDKNNYIGRHDDAEVIMNILDYRQETYSQLFIYLVTDENSSVSPTKELKNMIHVLGQTNHIMNENCHPLHILLQLQILAEDGLRAFIGITAKCSMFSIDV